MTSISLKTRSKKLFFQHSHPHSVYTVRPYICQLCDAGFTSVQQLDSHSRLHTANS